MATKTKSPVFPLPDDHEDPFTDYGFDPQIHYFQFLEEARNYKPPQAITATNLLLKLHKPIEPPKTKIKKQKWWKNALLFFNLKRAPRRHHHHRSGEEKLEVCKSKAVREVRSASSMSGPVYITESRSGSSTPYRRTYSGPISAGTLSLPYVSLKELNMEVEGEQRVSTSALPIYLVT